MKTLNFFRAMRRSGFALCLFFVFVTNAAAAPAPLAILTEVRGAVAVLRDGKSVAGKDGTQLFRGDVVRVSRGAATVYSVTRAPQTLGADQQLRVGAVGKVAAPSVWRGTVALLSSGFERRKIKNFCCNALRLWKTNCAMWTAKSPTSARSRTPRKTRRAWQT